MRISIVLMPIGIRIWIGINMEIRIRISASTQCRSPTWLTWTLVIISAVWLNPYRNSYKTNKHHFTNFQFNTYHPTVTDFLLKRVYTEQPLKSLLAKFVTILPQRGTRTHPAMLWSAHLFSSACQASQCLDACRWLAEPCWHLDCNWSVWSARPPIAGKS